MSVTLYTQPGCQPCKATERALNNAGIEYTKKDVSVDTASLQYVKSLGYMSTPVVVFGQESWTGFNPDRIKQIAIILDRNN